MLTLRQRLLKAQMEKADIAPSVIAQAEADTPVFTDDGIVERCRECGNTPETGACYFCKMD